MIAAATCTAKRGYRTMADIGQDLTCGNPAKHTNAAGELRCGIHSDEAISRRAAKLASERERQAAARGR